MKWKLREHSEGCTNEPERLLEEVEQHKERVEELSKTLRNRRSINRFADGLLLTFRRFDARNR